MPRKQDWPKVVSEVIFPRFWGVVCIEKCFRNFEILIRSAVSEMSRFTRLRIFANFFLILILIQIIVVNLRICYESADF